MSIRVVEGRGFTAADSSEAAPVALVSESAARRLFVGQDAIGAHVQVQSLDPQQRWVTIVGVVRDVRQLALDHDPEPAIYLPLAQVAQPPQGWASLIVRSNAPPAAIEASIRDAMLRVDPLQPVFHLQPMSTYVWLSVARQRFSLALISALGLLALVLAATGVFGVMSYLVRSRTRELGVRVAVGATPADVRRVIARQLIRCFVGGLVFGLAIAAAEARSLSTLIFGIGVFDLPTIASVTVVVIATTLLAAAAPMRRASRVDPIVALRTG